MPSKTKDQIDQARQNFILSGKRLVPNGECHYCGFTVPRLAHWCSSSCATDYEAERAEITLRGGR